MQLPDLETLRALLQGENAGDRAFVDATLRMAFARTGDAGARAELLALHGEVKTAASAAHASLRADIAAASLSRPALRGLFDAVPSLQRDHFVEEVLGIAYPPLDEPAPVPELIAYTPSGYDEILHVLDATELGPGDRFLDVGSGLGKAVMLATLLAGATSTGVERDPALHAMAEDAARTLRLKDASFQHADALEMSIDDPDVVFMFVPFTGATLARVLGRLLQVGQGRDARARSRFLCAAALDLARYPELVAVGRPKSWLQVYAWR